MSYTLEQLSTDIRNALKTDPGPAGKQVVCGLVSRALLDKEFVAKDLTADQCRPRKVLYEDPELGFCVCGHVYENPGARHAARPRLELGDLRPRRRRHRNDRLAHRQVRQRRKNPTLVEPERTYVLQQGDAHFYDVGVVHLPKRDGLTKLIRIEGKNLDHVKRSNIKAA